MSPRATAAAISERLRDLGPTDYEPDEDADGMTLEIDVPGRWLICECRGTGTNLVGATPHKGSNRESVPMCRVASADEAVEALRAMA